jgi:hypothetical protein
MLVKLNILTQQTIDDLKEITATKNLDELKIVFMFPKKLDEYINNNYINNNLLTPLGKKLIFYIFFKKLNIKILEKTLLFEELYKIYNKFTTNINIGQGCIAFLLFNSKRFGDWAQVELAKKYYFILQTKDFYCKMYSLLIGAPIIIKSTSLIKDDEDEETIEEVVNEKGLVLYNYNIPDSIFSSEYNKLFVIVNDKGTETKIENPKIRYTGLRSIETPVSREFYDKYIQYKIKYLELKERSRKNFPASQINTDGYVPYGPSDVSP